MDIYYKAISASENDSCTIQGGVKTGPQIPSILCLWNVSFVLGFDWIAFIDPTEERSVIIGGWDLSGEDHKRRAQTVQHAFIIWESSWGPGGTKTHLMAANLGEDTMALRLTGADQLSAADWSLLYKRKRGIFERWWRYRL